MVAGKFIQVKESLRLRVTETSYDKSRRELHMKRTHKQLSSLRSASPF